MDSSNVVPSDVGYVIVGSKTAFAAADNNTSAQAFLKSIRPLLSFYRFLALTPIGVYINADGEHIIKKSRSAQIYSGVAMAIFWILLMMKCITSFSDPHKGHFGIYYVYARSFLYFSISFTCLRKCDEILFGIRKIADLGVDFPMKIVWTTIVLPCVGFGVMVAFTYTDLILIRKATRSFLSLMSITIMYIGLLGVCSLFSWQVAVLGKAIRKLNQYVSTFLKDPSSFNAESLRPIMRAHDKLHEICLAMNSAYGYSMLFMLALVFLEAVFCIAYCYDKLDYSDRIPALIWTALQAIPSVTLMQICQNAENELFEWEIQLRHQKLHHGAAGFFSLNASQIQTEFSTIVCYAVIMMQIF